METTKKSKTKKTNGISESKIITSYKEFLLTEGRKPTSIFKFCKDLGIAEEEFYKHFGSFESLEKTIWQGYFETTRNSMETDPAYIQFTAREKILTFYFSFAELLKAERSFVLYHLKSIKKSGVIHSSFKSFKSSFDNWINGVLNEGKSTGEIAKRPFLDERYSILFWMQLMFILQFWSRDESINFEKTDAAIEKSVMLAFDLIGKGVLDNAIDFGKFLYQNARN